MRCQYCHNPDDLRNLGKLIGSLKNLKALPKEKAAEAKHYILEGVREIHYK